MKLNKVFFGLSVGAVALATAVSANAGEVRYEGQPEAVAICRAILADDATAVKKLIEKSAPRHTSRHVLADYADNFMCNDMPLEQFAQESGASEALAYLGGSDEATVAVASNASSNEV